MHSIQEKSNSHKPEVNEEAGVAEKIRRDCKPLLKQRFTAAALATMTAFCLASVGVSEPASAKVLEGSISNDQEIDFDLETLDELERQKGDEFLSGGHLLEALEKYNEALRLNAGNLNALAGRAMTLRYLGDFKASVRDWSKLIDHSYKLSTSHLMRGLCFRDLEMAKSALSDFYTAAALFGKEGNANGIKTVNFLLFDHHRREAQEMLFEGKYERALLAFDEAMSYKSDSPDTFVDRAIVKFMLEDVKGAFEDLAIAIKLAPLDDRAYTVRAQINYRNGDYELAFADSQIALEINPRGTQACFIKAVSLQALGKGEEAELAFSEYELVKNELAKREGVELINYEFEKLINNSASRPEI